MLNPFLVNEYLVNDETIHEKWTNFKHGCSFLKQCSWAACGLKPTHPVVSESDSLELCFPKQLNVTHKWSEWQLLLDVLNLVVVSLFCRVISRFLLLNCCWQTHCSSWAWFYVSCSCCQGDEWIPFVRISAISGLCFGACRSRAGPLPAATFCLYCSLAEINISNTQTSNLIWLMPSLIHVLNIKLANWSILQLFVHVKGFQGYKVSNK